MQLESRKTVQDANVGRRPLSLAVSLSLSLSLSLSPSLALSPGLQARADYNT